jgi:hypothetical protein
LQAAEAERHAKQREAERADGERRAKEREAERAAGERQAKLDADSKRQEAETNLAFAKKGNEILGSVFAGLDPKANYATVAELRNALRDNLSKAVRDLEGSAIGAPLEVAKMQTTLGDSLRGLGEPLLAVEVYQKALATRKAKLGPDHPGTLSSMGAMASAYEDSGQLDKAVRLFEETLEKAKAQLGPNHPDTLRSMNNLAEAYLLSRQLAKAMALLEEALEKWKANLGPDHPDTLVVMNNLAVAYLDSGQPAKAVPLFEEVLEKRKAELGPDHPHTLSSMHNLAVAYLNSGQLVKAVRLFEETLEKLKAQLGPDHPHTLRSMSYLAGAYQDSGQVAKAVRLFEETLEKRKAKLGPDHPETLRSMSNLARAYWRLNRLDRSIPIFEDVLKRREKQLGRQHPDTSLDVTNLGVNYKDAGRLAEAIPLLEESYAASKKLPSLRWVSAPLLDGYQKAGKLTEATKLMAELLVDLRQQLPKDSPQLAGELARFGHLLLQSHAFSEAEPLLRECLAIREKHIPDSWYTFNAQSMLGGALLGQKKNAEAEPLLVKGYEGMKIRAPTIPQQGGGELRLPEAVDRLIELYEALDKPDEVKKWQAARAKYPSRKELAPPPREKK